MIHMSHYYTEFSHERLHSARMCLEKFERQVPGVNREIAEEIRYVCKGEFIICALLETVTSRRQLRSPPREVLVEDKNLGNSAELSYSIFDAVLLDHAC